MAAKKYIQTVFFAAALVIGGGRLCALVPPQSQISHLTRKEILTAMHHAVHYLKRKCKPGVYWNNAAPGGWAFGGCTALATYALLQTGLATGDPHLSPDSTMMRGAIRSLVKLHPHGTYVAGLQLAALTSEPMSVRGYRRAIRRAADFLIKSEHANGAYDYYWSGTKPHEAMPARWDNSNTQYGVLGVWCAEAGGYVYPPMSYWRMAEKHWRSCQDPDGGWCYQGHGTSTRSMTTAGLATLYIADQYLHPYLLDVHRPNSAIQRGLSWLTKHIHTKGNLYYLYGLERVGLASGLRFIGGHNWYRMGARIILKAQCKLGEWDSGVLGESTNVIPTAYALLFLARGLNPVIFNKLSYPGYWNLRPHDDQNITTWIGNTLEESLNWGVADIHSSPHRWLNAPILLITGDTAVTFNTRQIARLRWYVQHGGMIFSVCENDSPAFNTSMIHAANQLFPGNRMITLPATSPIYNIQYSLKSQLFHLQALSNGIRILWLHCPADLSAGWQTMETVTEAGDFQLAENIDLYATGETKPSTHLHFFHPWRARKPVYELDATFTRLAGPSGAAHQLNLASIHALVRFALRHGVQLNVTFHTHTDFPSPAQDPVTYVVVSTDKMWTRQQRRAIAQYIRHGGQVIIENYSGTPLENRHLRKVFAMEFPSHPLQRLPRQALVTARSPAIPIKHLRYNSYYNRYHRPSQELPMLGMQYHHRRAVIILKVNLSNAWLRNNYWGINALATPSARRVALDLLIDAARTSKGALKFIAPPPKPARIKPSAVTKPHVTAPPPPPPTPPHKEVIPLPPTITLH